MNQILLFCDDTRHSLINSHHSMMILFITLCNALYSFLKSHHFTVCYSLFHNEKSFTKKGGKVITWKCIFLNLKKTKYETEILLQITQNSMWRNVFATYSKLMKVGEATRPFPHIIKFNRTDPDPISVFKNTLSCPVFT